MERSVPPNVLHPWFSKCDPWISWNRVVWVLVRNAILGPHPDLRNQKLCANKLFWWLMQLKFKNHCPTALGILVSPFFNGAHSKPLERLYLLYKYCDQIPRLWSLLSGCFYLILLYPTPNWSFSDVSHFHLAWNSSVYTLCHKGWIERVHSQTLDKGGWYHGEGILPGPIPGSPGPHTCRSSLPSPPLFLTLIELFPALRSLHMLFAPPSSSPSRSLPFPLPLRSHHSPLLVSVIAPFLHHTWTNLNYRFIYIHLVRQGPYQGIWATGGVSCHSM